MNFKRAWSGSFYEISGSIFDETVCEYIVGENTDKIHPKDLNS